MFKFLTESIALVLVGACRNMQRLVALCLRANRDHIILQLTLTPFELVGKFFVVGVFSHFNFPAFYRL